MSRRIVLLLAIVVAVIGIIAIPSAAGLSDDGGHAADVDVNEPTAQTTNNCGGCHADGSVEAQGPDSVEVCAECHQQTVNQFTQSTHYGEDSYADITCTDCHEPAEDSWFTHFRAGPHGEQNPTASLSPEDNCAQSGCHGYGSKALVPDGKTSGVTHVNTHHPEYGEWNETEDAGWNASTMSSHSEPAEGYTREKSCLSCKSTAGAIANIEEPGIYERNEEAVPNPENMTEFRITCVACHEPHSIVEGGDILRGSFEDSSTLCAQCHNTEISHEFTQEVKTEHAEVHHSQWEMYRTSKYVNNSSSHPELECASCHMPGTPHRETANEKLIAPQTSGHSFDVNTTRLESEYLSAPDYRKCNTCHQDLEATIQEQRRITQRLAEVAAEMRGSSNQTLHKFGYANNTELATTWKQARFWVSFVEHGGSGIHNPEMVSSQMAGAIQDFHEVQKLAYQKRIAELNEELEQASQEPQTTTPPEETTTTTTTPGMGVGIALVAILGGALVAIRRWT